MYHTPLFFLNISQQVKYSKKSDASSKMILLIATDLSKNHILSLQYF